VWRVVAWLGQAREGRARQGNFLKQEDSMVAKKVVDKKKVVISAINTKSFSFTIRNMQGSSLICHRFSEKSIGEIEAKQQKTAKQAKAARDPDAEFHASLYSLNDSGGFGFPASGLKKACVRAASYADGMPMTKARGAFHVIGDLLEIKGAEPEMRRDIVRLKNGNADMRYRGEFDKWKMVATVVYNENIISKEELMNLVNLAGFHVGLGDWRPECNGSHGMFEIEGANA